MKANIQWKTGFSFNGTADSGFAIPISTTIEKGGAGDGTSPMELVLIGLGGCTAMDVISILEKKRQKVSNFEVILFARRAIDHPHVFTEISIEFVFTGHDIDPEAVRHAIELSETKYCSVSAMISKTAKIETKFTISEG